MGLTSDLVVAPLATVLEVEEASQVGHARRAAVDLARRVGLDETRSAEVGIVASELGSNLHSYAREGVLVLQPLQRGGEDAIELLAVDRGPGMDVRQALKNGYSTGGSSGTGLGAVRRLATEFEVASRVGAGSVVLARLFGGKARPGVGVGPVRLGAFCAPTPGEDECGDRWAVAVRPDGATVIVVDGLGHGPFAATAADEALRAFAAVRDREPVAILERIHEALRGTRGAAAAVARLDLAARAIRFAGVGNIEAGCHTPDGIRHLVSVSGILGARQPRIREFAASWPSEGILVLHSDGIDTQWRVDDDPALLRRHPALLAGMLLGRHRRVRDDATALALAEDAATDHHG